MSMVDELVDGILGVKRVSERHCAKYSSRN